MNKKKIFRITLYTIIAIALLAIVFNVTVISIARNINFQKNYFLSEGPWKEEAIWLASDGELYLVCLKNEGRIDVNAYIQINDQWSCIKATVKQNSRIVDFEDDNGNILFSARAKLKNERELILTVIDCNIEHSIKNESIIILQKYSMEEYIYQLPFNLFNKQKQ